MPLRNAECFGRSRRRSNGDLLTSTSLKKRRHCNPKLDEEAKSLFMARNHSTALATLTFLA